jgi:hypothetical protein
VSSGRYTSAKLSVAFHIKEDWLVECVAKAKKKKVTRVSMLENVGHSRVCGRIILNEII